MIGFQGQTLSLIFSLFIVVAALSVRNVSGESNEPTKEDKSLLENEEFKHWIELQEERVVQKIMEKITSPNDTKVQHNVKVAVARYLVNVTFTAMTKRLEQQKSGRKQSFIPATAALPSSAVTESPNLPTEIATLSEKNETINIISNISSATVGPTDKPLIFKVNGEVTPTPTFNGKDMEVNSTFISVPFSSIGVESIAPAYSTLTEQIAAEGGIVTTTQFPLFAALSSLLSSAESAPAPESTQNQNQTQNQSTPESSQDLSENGTTTEKPKPIWEEILTFNFSAALMGGANASSILNRLNINTGGDGNLLSRLNLTGLGGGGSGGGGLLGNLNLTALGGGNGGEGGPLSRLNLSALTGGGNGGGDLLSRLNLSGLTGGNGGEGGPGGLLARLNLTGLTGGSGGEGGAGGLLARLNLTGLTGGSGGEGGAGGLLARLNLTGLGGGEGGGLLARLNLTGLTGGGNGGQSLLDRLNLTGLVGGGNGGGNLLSRLNLTGGPAAILSRLNLGGGNMMKAEDGNSTGDGNSTTEAGGLMFNLLPGAPEGLFNIPTPPPKNDSVRLSQIALGNQVEQLMGSINNSNLTGIVESSINIASPSTVGVLVNALLNILLCNPIDRFNGNCGIE